LSSVAARLRRQLRGIGLEEHAVADIDDEILLAAGQQRRPLRSDRAAAWRSRNRQRRHDDGCEFGAADDAHHVHSGASIASVVCRTWLVPGAI
jgi:hypothetical protein